MPYGVVGQLVASACGRQAGQAAVGGTGRNRVNSLAVGADLVGVAGAVLPGCRRCIDDLHWADGPSARALLFADAPGLQADRVLT